MRHSSKTSIAVFAIALLYPGIAPAAPLSIDIQDRDAVVAAFHELYLGTEDYALHTGWTGSLATCDPGELSPEFHADVINRINYFRAMAGVPADIELSPEMNQAAQVAALMMAANGSLSHNPPSTWSCYDPIALPAASGGNLSIGFNIPRDGPAAVLSQMLDKGASNIDVSHRRWLLSTRAPKYFGNGSIPMSPSPTHPNELVSASVFWLITDDERQPVPDQAPVAWPPAGFVPATVVFPRWSCGSPDLNANFSSAVVSMSDSDGNPIPLQVIYRAIDAGVADPTIVWEPDIDLATLDGDTTFNVHIEGITGGTPPSADYQVTIIDPFVVTPLILDGPLSPSINHSNTYHFPASATADSYDFRYAQLQAGEWLEAADSPDSPVIDRTSPTLSLKSSTVRRSGTHSFHLNLNDGDLDQHFELGRGIVASPTSRLDFHHAFRYVGTGTQLTAEVLPEGGSWTPVWSRSGQCGQFCGPQDWDHAWSPISISLGEFAGQVISIRFRYLYHDGYEWWGYSPGDDQQHFGAFIDDIRVTASEELAGEIVERLSKSASTLTFRPILTGDYLLQLRPIIGGAPFAYGPALKVSAQAEPPVATPAPIIRTVEVNELGSICLHTTNFDPSAPGYELQMSSDLSPGSWKIANFDVVTQSNTNEIELCVPAVAGSLRCYFRIVFPAEP